MVLKISELKGLKIKKDLRKAGIPVSHVIKRYHNKHKDGSGNFGFTVRVGNGWNDLWFTIDGEYNQNGEVTVLEIKDYGYSGDRLDEFLETSSYQAMIQNLVGIFRRLLLQLL